MKKKKISAIVCAYNEEKTIKKVLKNIAKHELVEEIVVVNDGSEDKTKDIVDEYIEKYRLHPIHLKKNKGKGNALAVGIETAKNDILIFVDADLENFHPKYINKMIKPLIKGEADFVLGQPDDTAIPYQLNPFKRFTGERALHKKDIMPIIEKMKEERFGVETLMNLFYFSEGMKTLVIPLKGLKHPWKYNKVTPIEASQDFISEFGEIARSVVKNRDLLIKKL